MTVSSGQTVHKLPAAGLRQRVMDEMKEYAIVIAGGRIDDDFALRFLSERTQRTGAEKPLLIAADRGLVFLDRHGFVPDWIVGDFDSAREEYVEEYLRAHPHVQARKHSWEKDYTDTEIAARRAADLGCRKIDFLGATGGRFDHTLGCVQVLAMLLERGVYGRIIDPCNRISMHNRGFHIRKKEQWGKYVSFFAWGEDVQSVTLTGFHFPLTNGVITSSRTITVSNQIEAECAEVSFGSGQLLMVESKDRTNGVSAG